MLSEDEKECDEVVIETPSVNLPGESMSAGTKIFFHRQRTKQRMGDIEVGKHLQFDHLVGDVKEALGIHLGCLLLTFSRTK